MNLRLDTNSVYFKTTLENVSTLTFNKCMICLQNKKKINNNLTAPKSIIYFAFNFPLKKKKKFYQCFARFAGALF